MEVYNKLNCIKVCVILFWAHRFLIKFASKRHDLIFHLSEHVNAVLKHCDNIENIKDH